MLISGCYLMLMAPAARWDGEPVFPDEVAFYALADVYEGRKYLNHVGEMRLTQVKNEHLQDLGFGASTFVPAKWVPETYRMSYWTSFQDGDNLGYTEPFELSQRCGERFTLPGGGWGYCC